MFADLAYKYNANQLFSKNRKQVHQLNQKKTRSLMEAALANRPAETDGGMHPYLRYQSQSMVNKFK